MRNPKKLAIEQLDGKLKPLYSAKEIIIPFKGWIFTIRKSLNMTLKQLGAKMKMSSQGIRDMEEREARGSLSIKTLREFAKAMDMKFIYGFLPNDGTIESMIQKRSYELAEKIVLRTSHNMKLEDQENSKERIQKSIEETAVQLKNDLNRILWD